MWNGKNKLVNSVKLLTELIQQSYSLNKLTVEREGETSQVHFLSASFCIGLSLVIYKVMTDTHREGVCLI